ncbi:MAG: non-ribosomal peptide synthetase, partial [Legionella sp.]
TDKGGVDAFPLNANGKLDRTALTIPEFHLSEKYREPRNAIEQQLAALWAKELGLKQIGIDDNFFELGGHSLAAARIISQINHHMSKQISFQDLYHHPSIAELSQLIEQNQDAQQEKLHLEPPLNMDWFSLSDFQLMLWLSHTFEPKAGKLNIVARQRVQGHVDKRRLEAAFHTLIKNQQVLMYQVMKLRPAQRLQDEVQFVLSTEHLVDEVECSLEKSMTELRTLYPWPKNASLVIARLFYLPQDRTELQIAMPHIICDEDSLHILFSQLSKLYLTHNESIISQDADYQKYIVNEQHYLENHLDRDLKYWNEYLKNACLLTVPSHYVVKNCQNYSTYQKIDTDDLEQLKQYCAQQQISLHDALCAALILALRDGSEQRKRDTGYLYINIVKSTRDDPDYDATIGCFLRLEPIKVGFRKNMTLLALSEEIRQEKIHTSFYQRCPSLIKLASTYSLRRKNNVFNKFLIRCALAIYAQLSGLSKTYRKIFNVCLARLMGFDRRNQFLINLNIQNSFMADNPSTQFLGLKAQTIAEKHYDLLTIDSVLDVCVLNDLHAQQSYLVFSANLQPEFREYLAMRMMEHIRDVVGVVTV